MFKKLGLAAGCVALCAGCSTVGVPDHGPVQMAGARVSADLVDMVDLKVYVNGQKVIDDQLSLPDGQGKFRGQYGGRPVLASCSSSRGISRGATACVISMGGDSRTMTF